MTAVVKALFVHFDKDRQANEEKKRMEEREDAKTKGKRGRDSQTERDLI